jgi:hypothetical protein
MSSQKLAIPPCRARRWLPSHVEPGAGCSPRPRLTPPRSCQPFHLRTYLRVAWPLPCFRDCRMLPRQPSQDSGGRNGTSASRIRGLRVNLPSPRSCDLTPVHCFVVALSVTSAFLLSLLVSASPSINLVLEDTSASALNVEGFAVPEPLGIATSFVLTSTDMEFHPSADFRSGDGAVQDPAGTHSVNHLAITSSPPFARIDQPTLPYPCFLNDSFRQRGRTSISVGDDRTVHLAPIRDDTMVQIQATCENETLKKELDKRSKKIQQQQNLLVLQKYVIRNLTTRVQEHENKLKAPTVPIQAQSKTIEKLNDKVGKPSAYSQESSKRSRHSASSSRRVHHCMTCGKPGHNKKTCTQDAVSMKP